MKHSKVSGASPVTPVAGSAAKDRESLDTLLSAYARGGISERQTMQSRLVGWARSCSTETFRTILTDVLFHSENGTHLQTVSRTMLELVVKDCSSRRDEIADGLLSKLPRKNDIHKNLAADLLVVSMGICPASSSKIDPRTFQRP